MASITQKFAIHDIPEDVFIVKYSPDGMMLVAGCNDGSVRVYNGKNGTFLHSLRLATNSFASKSGINDLAGSLPVTSLQFRPSAYVSSTRNVLLAVGADGSVNHWHVPSGRCLSSFHEANNQIFACAFRPDGQQFATAGKDKCIRIYDESAVCVSGNNSGIGADISPQFTTPILTLEASIGLISDSYAGTGHSNRIFALVWHPTDPNIILSAGWDNTVQIWDLRLGRSVRSLFGPHVCGDSLSVSPDGRTVLTGSWRPDSQLQLWDFHSGQEIGAIPEIEANEETAPYLASLTVQTFPSVAEPNGASLSSGRFATVPRSQQLVAHPGLLTMAASFMKPVPTLVYTAAFSKNTQDPAHAGSLFFAGGSGRNVLRVYRTQDSLKFADDIKRALAGKWGVSKHADASTGSAEGNGIAPGGGSGLSLPETQYSPLLAEITGLPQAVFSADWDGAGSIVIAGGNQPIRVLELQTKGPQEGIGGVAVARFDVSAADRGSNQSTSGYELRRGSLAVEALRATVEQARQTVH